MIIARSDSAAPHKHQNRGTPDVTPPDFIKRLKRSLKAVESETIPNRRLRRQKAFAAADGDDNMDDFTSTTELDTNGRAFRLSPGRFGQLWRKERKCWSNFCHPSLKGLEASPGHEAVWRTVDRAKIVGFTDYNNFEDNEDTSHNMHAIIELSGDGFVLGQIPRIISSVVAMTNGWIPSGFFEYTTRPDVYLPAPSMVPFLRNRMYFHTARYHFHELTAIGVTEINDQPDPVNAGTEKEMKWEINLRHNLLKETPPVNYEVENEWLYELHDNCKVIQSEMTQISNDINSLSPQSDDTVLHEDDLNDLSPVPDESYDIVLNQLRDIVRRQRWPATSGARSKVIKASGTSEKILTTKKGSVGSVFPGVSSGSFTIVNDELLGNDSGIPLPHANGLFPDLVKVVFELEKRIIDQNEAPLPGAEGMQRTSPLTKRPPSTHCAVNRNAQFTPHVDSGRGQGQTLSMIVGLGDYKGGETLVEGTPYGIRYNPLEFNGWKQLHWTAPFTGERFSLVYFTPAMTLAEDADQMNEDEHATMLAEAHSQLLSSILKPLQFRPNSTDALCIMELLDSEKCAYELEPNAEIQGFTLEGHACVLDVGAHIGTFSRLMLAKGSRRIIAYEPEPSNYDLLIKNLDMGDASSLPTIELHSEAVAHGPAQLRTLVRARNQNDGTQNTWRHSLEEYSQYNDVDKTKDLPSESQCNVLERLDVTSIPFFEGALVDGVTLVKLDCEGAEIDILLSDESSRSESWLDVTDLVCEWSFTKERRVSVLHKAVMNLKQAGFTVFYEGQGSWWDTDQGALWPYPNDLVIFAHKSD
jgi:FkbM family methyltransferase